MYNPNKNQIKEREDAIDWLAINYPDSNWVYVLVYNRHDSLENDWDMNIGVYSDKDEASKAMMWRFEKLVNENQIYKDVLDEKIDGSIKRGKYEIHLKDTHNNGFSIFIEQFAAMSKFINPNEFNTPEGD